MAPRVLIPQIVEPKQPGDTLRRLREARDRAYLRATDPRWPLRDPRGAIPMRGAYAMPASGAGAGVRRAVGEDVAQLRSERRTGGRRQPQGWTLGPAAPAWLCRTWKERSRKVPKPSREETAR